MLTIQFQSTSIAALSRFLMIFFRFFFQLFLQICNNSIEIDLNCSDFQSRIYTFMPRKCTEPTGPRWSCCFPIFKDFLKSRRRRRRKRSSRRSSRRPLAEEAKRNKRLIFPAIHLAALFLISSEFMNLTNHYPKKSIQN